MDSLEFVCVYIDDFLCISTTFGDHLDKLHQVRIKLHDAGLKINVPKSLFYAIEIEYLGYVLTREGINSLTGMGEYTRPFFYKLQ